MKTNADRIKGWFYRWCPQSPTPRFSISNISLLYLRMLPWIASVHARRIITMILPLALIIGALNGFYLHHNIYLDSVGLRITDIGIQFLVFDLSRVILLPVMFFIISYLLGKRLNIEAEIKPIIAFLLLGGFIGNFIGYLVANVILFGTIYTTGNLFFNALLSILDSLFNSLSSLPTLFFVSFTGMAIASLRNIGTGDQMPSPVNDDPVDRAEGC